MGATHLLTHEELLTDAAMSSRLGAVRRWILTDRQAQRDRLSLTQTHWNVNKEIDRDYTACFLKQPWSQSKSRPLQRSKMRIFLSFTCHFFGPDLFRRTFSFLFCFMRCRIFTARLKHSASVKDRPDSPPPRIPVPAAFCLPSLPYPFILFLSSPLAHLPHSNMASWKLFINGKG